MWTAIQGILLADRKSTGTVVDDAPCQAQEAWSRAGVLAEGVCPRACSDLVECGVTTIQWGVVAVHGTGGVFEVRQGLQWMGGQWLHEG